MVAPGDMGHAVADVLRQGGLGAVTCLSGRGPDSIARASRAGMEGLPSLQVVVREADAFLSILPPARALDLAGEVAVEVKGPARSGDKRLRRGRGRPEPGEARRWSGW